MSGMMKKMAKNIQFVLLIPQTSKTYKTFLYPPLNLAAARFNAAFRLIQLTSIILRLKVCCCQKIILRNLCFLNNESAEATMCLCALLFKLCVIGIWADDLFLSLLCSAFFFWA